MGTIAGLGLALALGGWLRWTPPSAVQDLRPRYDALEYEEVGRNASRGLGFAIVVGGRAYGPAHGPGFPALLAGYFRSFPDEGPGSGIRVVFACALAAIAGTWCMGWIVGGPWCGAAAGLLLALAPLHVRWSRAVMSEVPSSAAIAWIGAWSLAAFGRRRDAATWFLIGGCVGLAGAIRQPNVAVGMPIALLLAFRSGGRRERLRCLVALGMGFVAGLLPILAYNHALFGSPFRDGLSVWVPSAHFGWDLPRFRPGGGSDPNGIFYARLVAGGGSLYPEPIALLLVVAAALGLRAGGGERRLVVLTVGLMVGLLVAYLPFFTQGDRYFVPALPLLAATAALPMNGRRAGWSRRLALGLIVLGAARVASPPMYDSPDRPLGEVAALRRLAARLEANAAVFARANAIFFERILRREGDRILVSLGLDDVRFGIAIGNVPPFNPEAGEPAWMREVVSEPFDSARVEQLVRNLRNEGRPVYLTTMLGFQAPSIARLATLFVRLGAERVPLGPGEVVFRLGPSTAPTVSPGTAP